jgi:hypothetical protein
MRRLSQILSLILIGALAVALGMGVYLHKANQDRERLAQAASDADRAAREAQDKQAQAIEEANKKLADANAEVAKAQQALQALKEEHDLLLTATSLPEPKTSLFKGWNEAVNLLLGASIKYPNTSAIETDDANSLTLSRAGNSSPLTDTRWFSLTPWNERLEQELTSQLATSTPVSYLVHGRVLVGHVGAMSDTSAQTFILKVRAGEAQFLIWARDPDTLTDHRTLLQALSTLDFKS